MLRRLRPRSIYDAFAVLALFVALGGTSALALSGSNTVFSDDIANDNFNSPTEGQGGLVASDLRAGSVTGSEVADGSLTGADVFDNTISGADITNGSLTGADVFDNTIGGGDITNNSLTGADINEGSLGTVPSSVLGGVGRSGLRLNGSTGPGSCNPESGTFVNCDISANLDLSRPARVLVIGSVQARVESNTTFGTGSCRLGTTSGTIPGTTVVFGVDDIPDGFSKGQEHLSLAGVTGVFPAGQQHGFGIDCAEGLSGGLEYFEARVTAVALSDQ
jgi:hypothetical protein